MFGLPMEMRRRLFFSAVFLDATAGCAIMNPETDDRGEWVEKMDGTLALGGYDACLFHGRSHTVPVGFFPGYGWMVSAFHGQCCAGSNRGRYAPDFGEKRFLAFSRENV